MQLHKGMTPDEAQKELRRIEVETHPYVLGDNAYDFYDPELTRERIK